MEGKTPDRSQAHPIFERRHEFGQQLAQIAGQCADASGLVAVRGVCTQGLAVLFDGKTTRGCIHDDRLDRSRSDQPPPSVYVPPRIGKTALMIGQVLSKRTTAAGTLGDERLDAAGIEDSR